MKIRMSNVTNSSSSSFLVAWPKRINKKSRKTVIEFIEPEKVDTILNDSTKGIKIKYTPRTIERITNIFLRTGGWLDEIPEELKSLLDEETKIINDNVLWNKHFAKYSVSSERYKEYKKDWVSFRKKLAEAFIKKTEGMWLYSYEYSDNDGEFYADMEHGRTFYELVYIQLSHH